MSEVTMPDTDTLFEVLCSLAHLNTTTADLHTLLNDNLQMCLNELPLTGAVVWLRSNEQAMLTPSGSRLPQGCSTSAITEENELLARAIREDGLILESKEAEPLILLPEGMAISLAPIEGEDTLLGLVGYIAANMVLEPMQMLLQANADLLSGPIVATWLRRQQAESEDVANTLFQFAGELRTKGNLEDILGTLNNLALRLFNCDWTAVYVWEDDDEGKFVPVHIGSRIGPQSVEGEPPLVLQETPILELVLEDPQPYSLRDLRKQPNALPVYAERHGLRGLVLIPIKYETQALGLLTLGYRTPLVPLSSRLTSLAQGLARLVAVALDRTIPK